jgi:hypothetical protein
MALLLGPGGVRFIVAESVILKHELLIVARSGQRSPNSCTSDRILAGLMALLVRPARPLRSAIVLKLSTLHRLDASSYTVPSQFGCQPCGCKDSLSERFLIMAGRVLVMEDEVRSKEYFFR